MRNWVQTLARASFRGVSFHVEREGNAKAGRAVVIHRYVKSEAHATEDMGRLPREFRVSAYLASDTSDIVARALLEACAISAPGLLVLPMFGPTLVRCTNCSGSHERTKLGYVGFDLDFVEAGQDGAAFPSLPIGDRLAASALDGLAGAVSAALQAA